VVQSIDGCVKAENSASLSIVGVQAGEDSHRLRNQSQALLIGAKTVLHDNPHLTVRHIPLEGPPPLRVVLDHHDTIPLNANIFKTEAAPTLCITSGRKERNELLLSQDVDILSWNKPDPISCSFLQKELAKRGVLQLLIEGGIMTISHFLQTKAFHELVVYIGPKILGKGGKRFSKGMSLSSFAESPLLNLVNTEQFGDSVRLTYHHVGLTLKQKE
jgi:diaminohydroxyphosphoribosylaminopyrimidine deaminase/5-amino-6-(5-phosphoribosylamino)uracil reductase